ncbi:Ras GTPase activating protein ira2, partial [Rhizopus stolonifer]
LLKRLLVSRNDFLERHRDLTMYGIYTRERLQASIGLEVALLVSLCSSDVDICTLALDCFKLLCTEVHLTERLDDLQPSSITIVYNMNCYLELTKQTGVVAGRKSQQRHIRRVLRRINHSSPGMLAAWEEAWKRWKFMTPIIARSSEDNTREDIVYEINRKGGGFTWHDKLRSNTSLSSRHMTPPSVNSARVDIIDDERSSEWRNYAGFLAALGGVCLMASNTPESLSPTSLHSKSTEFSSHSKHVMQPTEASSMIDKFIMEMVELLACDNLIVREWVREILGADLSPTLCHIMFYHLENTLSKCFGSDISNGPTCSPRYTLFVEQAILVLKQVLDRLEHKTENLFTVDFSVLINQYALYLNKLELNQTSLKIKIKMCQLVEVLMSKKESIILRQEFKLRNKLLEIIKADTAVQSSSFDASQIEKLQNDLDTACLKTIVVLLHHLPLQPSEPVVESDALAVRSKIFYKYFTYFLKLLNRCRISEAESDFSQTHSFDSQFINTPGLASLKNYTILALSNLLGANVDAVLTNILNQGTEFETLADTVMTDRYEKLIDMLVQNELILLSLCDICPSSDIDHAATLLFSWKFKKLAKNEADLFRKTSIATRLLSLYTKQSGAEYIRSVLLPVFQKLSERSREAKFFELDPSKIGPEEDINKNRNNVTEATEMFLNAICSSLNKTPRSFREICNFILTSVVAKFPEAKYTAVGSFIFLRFFCPAIVSPDTEGLVKNTAFISREMRRGLLISTKVIQNLANNVLFGAKETYMIVLNDFLTTNIYKVANFLREISKVPADSITEELVEIPQLDDKTYVMLHRVLYNNMNTGRIAGSITQQIHQFKDEDLISASKRDFDKFSTLLAQLGRPPEVTQRDSTVSKSYVYTASNQLYADFMRCNNHRNVESIVSKNIFYEGGVSKAGRPVFYLIMRRIIADSIDFELLVYHALQTLERASNRQYELFIDITRFDRNNEIPVQWVNQILQLMGEDKLENVAVCHMYNPDTYLRTYAKKLSRPIPHKFTKRVIFAVTLAEVHENISPSEVKLPKSTTSLETDPNAAFFPVNKVLKYSTQLPVTLKISAEFIQVMSARKQEIYYGLNTMSKLIQAKIWKTLAKVDDVLNLIIETFIQVSNEYGLGSAQAEALADTLVTLSNITVRSKLISYLRNVIHRSSFKPTKSLIEHPSWPEIAILIRFELMLSFNNRGPVKTIIPEILHVVSLVAGVGCTIVRASVHGIVVNMIQSICTTLPLSAANIKKLQLIMTELSESKCRLLFGLNRSNTNAFTISSETLNDITEPIPLMSLENIVSKLLEVINYAASTSDIANFWRARWMSLVASTAFQFNPAVQPRAFVVLGYLGREEIDDDLLYQILVALRGALAIFNESDTYLVTSIMMCLKNVVGSLPGDSRYLLQLFWVAVALVELNTGSMFTMAVELLQSVLRAIDSNGFFTGDSMTDVLLAVREPIADVARQLDTLCGVNFDSHFSFAVAGVLMKGFRYSDVKDAVYHGLLTFMDIERKQTIRDKLYEGNSIIDASTLGYVAEMLPIAAKNESVDKLLRMAGLTETDADSHALNGKAYTGIIDKLEITDNSTALLLISLLATMLNAADNELERLFIYGLLSEAAVTLPEVFYYVYDSLLPKMNQIVISSQTQSILESVESILITVCSDPVFTDTKNRPSLGILLDRLGFSALGDSTFGANSKFNLQRAKLASELIERIIS